MKGLFAGFFCLLLANCGQPMPVVTPEIEAQLRPTLINGQAVLDCISYACITASGNSRQELVRLFVTENWPRLGAMVMLARDESDLNYFYLGRAAEGLRAYPAARRYYQMAIHTIYHCDNALVNVCDGFNLPGDALPRLQYVEAMIAGQQAPNVINAQQNVPGSRSSQNTAAGGAIAPIIIAPPPQNVCCFTTISPVPVFRGSGIGGINAGLMNSMGRR